MICPNCGAEYEEGSLNCPYCHSENRKEAQKQKQQILSEYDNEAIKIRKDMENFPKQTAKKWTRYLLLGIGILFAAAIVLLAAMFLFGRVSAGAGYRADQAHLSKLESLFEAGEYDAITEYLRDKGLWSSSYEKYIQVSDVSRKVKFFEEELAYIEGLASEENLEKSEKEKHMEDWYPSAIEHAAAVLYYGSLYTQDKAILGNEAVLLAAYENCADRLKEMGYSEEEITAMIAAKEEGDMTPFLDKIRSYFVAKIS